MRRMSPTRWLGSLLLVCLCAGALPGVASSQVVGLAERGPRFLRATAGDAAPVAIDARSIPVLRRVVSLTLERATVGNILHAIERQTGLEFLYSRAILPVDRPVNLRAERISVAAALMEILVGADVDVLLTSSRQIALVRRAETVVEPDPGTVTGRVTDAKTGEGLAGADVSLEGTRRRTGTSADGRFRLTDVTPGSYTLVVRRIGYARQTRPVTVAEGQEVTVDVALEAIPTQLDEVVTTVTGEQRLRELGHVVGRINADSLVREAPVSNITELLTGRVPGLQVFTSSGSVGGEAALRIRSPNTIRLDTEPIVIVDGIRYHSGKSSDGGIISTVSVEPTSRLNDLNPNDIASIEVVKGPSAATLYGTDAANGVIVITTKRGQAGPTRWNAYAKGAATEIPEITHPDSYWGWGTATSSCTLRSVGLGSCTQDSVTIIPNPLNDPALTIFGAKPRWDFGANVSGGSEDIRYFFSADFEEATGPLQLPALMVEELRARLGGGEIPETQLEPNALSKFNLRANVGSRLAKTVDLQVNAGYTQSATRQATLINPFNQAPGVARPDQDPYGSYDPISEFAQSSTEWINRFYGSAASQWRPLEWLQTRATLGLDITSSNRYSLIPRDAWEGADGDIAEERARTLVSTAELGATASFQFGRASSRTSAGVQYMRHYSNALVTRGSDLRPGGASVEDAASVNASHYYDETVTLGSYVEQVFGLNDRLFLTGALRMDGASGFGSDYDAAIYPKAGISWIVSEEPWLPRLPGLDELRLRYAYGASGQQPDARMRRITFTSATGNLDGDLQNTVELSRLQNPDIRPERVKEHEFGLDAGMLGGRLHFDLTWNRRRTVDQINSIALPVGLGSFWTNIGLITGRGFEAQATARLIDTRAVSWDVIVTHATTTSMLEDLGGVAATYSSRGSLVEGYPLGARFMRPLLGYDDANGDGILDESEIQLGDTAVYVGRGQPGRSQTLTGVLGLFDQRVRISAFFERRSDFMQYNRMRTRQGTRERAAVDPTTPLDQQAELLARYMGAPAGQFQAAYTALERGDFTRLREVTFAMDLPDSWARAVRLRRATLSLSGRNLALWTDYSGPDPESARIFNYAGGEADQLPQSRTWVFRVDIGL